MNKVSQDKCISKGFSIIRKDDYPTPRIKIRCVVGRDWRTLEKFDTKAARDREFDHLMKNNEMMIDD